MSWAVQLAITPDMAKLNSKFGEFLSNIEPDEKEVRHAMAAHIPLRTHLAQDSQFGLHVVDTFLYGSYRRGTAVGNIKDVDIVVLTDLDPRKSENTPQNVLKKLKTAINRHYQDSENQEYQRRSIRVNDPLPDAPGVQLTLDVIPAFAPKGVDQPLLVPDRELKQWIPSHPKGHIKYATEMNDDSHAKGRFVPLVKIMKWWWKHQCEIRQPKIERPKPKGFWVEVMTGQYLDLSLSDYAEHFIAVLEKATPIFKAALEVPELSDPGFHGSTVKTNMTQGEFGVFLQSMKESLMIAKKAYSETSDLVSSILWQKIFGKAFPLADDGGSSPKAGPYTPPMPPRRREVG